MAAAWRSRASSCVGTKVTVAFPAERLIEQSAAA